MGKLTDAIKNALLSFVEEPVAVLPKEYGPYAEYLLDEDDDDGSVALKDKHGNMRVLMPRHVYEELLRWPSGAERK